MSDVIWVAIITGVLSALGSIITVIGTTRASTAKTREDIAVIKNEINTLSERQAKHNNLIERMYKVEAQIAAMKEGK